ncbi:hypothetical protein ACGFNY_44715 [Streptomyces chartreusis]|uniref:hypothetical protein n=1 Tax=Streptomyces chartreusis TaxID=1969 RepID=UPI003715932D
MDDRDIPGASRLSRLLTQLEKRLAERYAFHVFAKDSVNFGVLVTYRQTWVPQNYQVGDLVSTIPLAPKEIRRYTTKKVTKKTRAQKELEDNLHTRKTESADTSRTEREIIEGAQQKTNFNLTAKESLGGEGVTIESTQAMGGEEGTSSRDTKRKFRENVRKSAQEFRQQHRLEVETSDIEETESTGFHELQNPNDELTVTYLLYELQRTYRLSERIHKVTPVIMVANDVPAPHEIDDAWLVAHDWILRRVILDDSFRPALQYLTESFIGAETDIRILESNAQAQHQLVESLRQQIRAQQDLLARDQQDVRNAVRDLGASQQQQGLLGIVQRVFDPIGLTGKADTGAVSAAQTMVDYAEDTRDRAERERERLLAQLEVATTALQAAVDRLSAAVRTHYDKVAEIDRLRVHIKDNILYYMQAIWSHEPPDQRFFRLYHIDVPDIVPRSAGITVDIHPGNALLDALQGRNRASAQLPMPGVDVTQRKLVEIADLDTVLGYKGNYMIFALRQPNYLTLHMMQEYLDVEDEVRVRDPDTVSDLTADEVLKLAACVRSNDPKLYERHRDGLKKLLAERLSAQRPGDDLVVVPTSSLYMEALVGTHPLLEDFKLVHRALDVKKVQADVRHAELENIRLAARALKGKDDDPDIDRTVIVRSDGVPITVTDGS